jgi:predicted GTPase
VRALRFHGTLARCGADVNVNATPHATLHATLHARRRIAELAAQEGKAVVIVINKWDTVEDKSAEAMATAEANVKGQLRHISWAKCIFTSATQGAPPLRSPAVPA